MDHGTLQNLEAAFGGESMANRKYLFFADLAKQLGHGDLARLFRETAQQETEHAFAHFRLLHPELVVENPDALDQDAKNALLARCLELAIEGETYEFEVMYPTFAAQAQRDRDTQAVADFNEQIDESKEHAGIFKTAARNFGLLAPVEQHHAGRYSQALATLSGTGEEPQSQDASSGRWICKVCGVIYDPTQGDPDSGIAAGTPFNAIPEDWSCPICGTRKANFIPYAG